MIFFINYSYKWSKNHFLHVITDAEVIFYLKNYFLGQL